MTGTAVTHPLLVMATAEAELLFYNKANDALNSRERENDAIAVMAHFYPFSVHTVEQFFDYVAVSAYRSKPFFTVYVCCADCVLTVRRVQEMSAERQERTWDNLKKKDITFPVPAEMFALRNCGLYMRELMALWKSYQVTNNLDEERKDALKQVSFCL
jgi:hypothetical protein